MSVWTCDSIKADVGGVWLARPSDGARPLLGISTDTRTLRPEEAFFAIRGDAMDGHDFLAKAAAAHAGLLVVDRAELTSATVPAGVAVLRVPDVRKALGKLAHAHRLRLEGTRVIAVCGSNGKTTTVRLIESLLKTKLRGNASKKSFNNDIGVPTTILSARKGDQYLICEVGTNAPGEIATLGAIVEPDIAVITSIGREHLAFLGTVEGVAREEAAILASLRRDGHASVGIVTADAPALSEHLRVAPAVITFGVSSRADLRITRAAHAWETSADGVARPVLQFTVNDRWAFVTPLVGLHNAGNALAAVAVARRMGIDDETIARALASAAGPEMRWDRQRVGEIEIINDAYNANPDSTVAAVRTFADLYTRVSGDRPLRREDAAPPPPSRGRALSGHTDGRRVIVLGDMLELGDHAEANHTEVGERIGELGACDLLVCVGTLTARAAEAAEAAGVSVRRVADTAGGHATLIASWLAPGDTVLLKGSRGMRLERIIEAVKARGVGTPVVQARGVDGLVPG